jgi:5-methylthioadenosine/S-adenosylhomocysteine deaminase
LEVLVKLLIKHAHVVPGGGAAELPRADVLVEDGRIAAVAPDLPADATVLDATGLILTPGFVDSHRHTWQAPLRGIGPDMAMPEYFEVVLGRALQALTPADAGLATLLGAAEALDAGITTVFDWSNACRTPEHTDAVVDAFTTAGIRAVVAHPSPTPQWLRARTGLVTGAVSAIRPLGDTIALARDNGVLLSVHADRPTGELGPWLQLVHLNHLTAEDARRVAGSGTRVSITPIVERTMGHGDSAYKVFHDAGGRAGLGSDVCVNAPHDLFEPMRDTLRSSRPLRAAAILDASTVDSARACGLEDVVGTVEAGKRADLVLLDGLRHLAGTGPVAGAIVTTLGPRDVHTVLVDGRIRKREHRLVDLDLLALRDQAATRSRPERLAV